METLAKDILVLIDYYKQTTTFNCVIIQINDILLPFENIQPKYHKPGLRNRSERLVSNYDRSDYLHIFNFLPCFDEPDSFRNLFVVGKLPKNY